MRLADHDRHWAYAVATVRVAGAALRQGASTASDVHVVDVHTEKMITASTKETMEKQEIKYQAAAYSTPLEVDGYVMCPRPRALHALKSPRGVQQPVR